VGFHRLMLLRMLMLHVARGYSLRETVVRAKLANWTDISDVALLKRVRNSEEWQWRILYSIRLPSLVCDFFEVTATIGEGSGESLNRLPVGPPELILADAGYCSVAGEDREERILSAVKDTPLRRFGRVEEVAALAVLLASDEVTYMTGTEFTLDGGLLAGAAALPNRA
jgi:hypothetical protein